MYIQLALLVLIVSSMLACISSYRILAIMPFGSTSHRNTILPLIEGLADRNHQVTFITGQKRQQFENNPNIREIIISTNLAISVKRPAGKNSRTFFEDVIENPFKAQVQFLKQFENVPEQTAISTWNNPEVQDMLETDHFDVALISLLTGYIGYPFAWHFRCPFIALSPNVLFPETSFILGDSEHPEYVPFFMWPFTDRMSFLERTINTFLTHVFTAAPKLTVVPKLNSIAQHYFPGSPLMSEFETKVSLAFTNTHPSFSYPRAYPPGVVEIGAIQCRPAKQLPKVSVILLKNSQFKSLFINTKIFILFYK